MTDTGGVLPRRSKRYLCQKNDGHLVRVVGPAFEHGVRLGHDGRAAEDRASRHRPLLRAAARRRGPRRRPVRIEFCEADVLDAFDDWRRAVGVAASAGRGSGDASRSPESRRCARTSNVPSRVSPMRAAAGKARVSARTAARAVDPRARSAGPVGVAGARRGAGRRLSPRWRGSTMALIEAAVAAARGRPQVEAARGSRRRARAVRQPHACRRKGAGPRGRLRASRSARQPACPISATNSRAAPTRTAYRAGDREAGRRRPDDRAARRAGDPRAGRHSRRARRGRRRAGRAAGGLRRHRRCRQRVA